MPERAVDKSLRPLDNRTDPKYTYPRIGKRMSGPTAHGGSYEWIRIANPL
jgi:hypothetical protein